MIAVPNIDKMIKIRVSQIIIEFCLDVPRISLIRVFCRSTISLCESGSLCSVFSVFTMSAMRNIKKNNTKNANNTASMGSGQQVLRGNVPEAWDMP